MTNGYALVSTKMYVVTKSTYIYGKALRKLERQGPTANFIKFWIFLVTLPLNKASKIPEV